MCSAEIWCWSHIWQNILSHVSQKSNSSFTWKLHFGTTSRLNRTIKSSSWLTINDGGNDVTPPDSSQTETHQKFLFSSVVISFTSWQYDTLTTDWTWKTNKDFHQQINIWINLVSSFFFLCCFLWFNYIWWRLIEVVHWQYARDIVDKLCVNKVIISAGGRMNPMKMGWCTWSRSGSVRWNL